MFSKVVICLAFLAVALAERPRVGLQIPPISRLHSPQVVGGEEAPVGRYPHIVSLQAYGGQHFCAGSILNEGWIVTAAHCAQAVSARDITVKAGKHNINIVESEEQTVQVKRSIIHNDFGGGVGPYDIALLELAFPLKFTKRVQAIKLPAPESEPTGEAWLCGWGSVSSSRNPVMPAKLQQVKMGYIDYATCTKTIEHLTGSSPVDEKSNVCTGPLHETTSACSGDSGGPLMSLNGGKAVLTGIVSWGVMPCGIEGAPSVYTKVSSFNSWIEEQIGS